jgi:hypothetical protein
MGEEKSGKALRISEAKWDQKTNSGRRKVSR